MITVVSGLPRSGTSMMMQMLEKGNFPLLIDDERVSDESNSRGYYEYKPVKKLLQANDWLLGVDGKVLKIVSIFLNHLHPGMQYKIIFMQRDLDAILASQAKMLKMLGGHSGASNQDQLKQVYKQQVDRSINWINTQANMEFITIQYEAALADANQAASEVSRFLNQGDAKAMASAIIPALCHQ